MWCSEVRARAEPHVDLKADLNSGAPSPRRRCLVAALPVLFSLSGCGFALRQPPRLAFATIALAGFAPRSPLVEALRRQLLPQMPVLDDASRAAVVLQALDEQRDRIVVASTSAAQVRELQLRLKLKFRVYGSTGRELIAPSELVVARDLSYRETAALAKEYEEQELFREMQNDLIHQLLRRLSALVI